MLLPQAEDCLNRQPVGLGSSQILSLPLKVDFGHRVSVRINHMKPYIAKSGVVIIFWVAVLVLEADLRHPEFQHKSTT
jgi:hypothetical protein